MAKVAIDIVLIPPKDIIEKSVLMSRQLFEETGNDMVLLNSQACLPHISLAMGCVDEEDLLMIIEKIRKISSEIFPLELTFTKVNVTDEGVSDLSIEKTSGIQELHEKIMRSLEPYLKDATTEALYPNPSPSETTVKWIMNYKDNTSFSNFYPHLTIGYGELRNIESPITFSAEKIAICHLGRYCTCRKILWSNRE